MIIERLHISNDYINLEAITVVSFRFLHM